MSLWNDFLEHLRHSNGELSAYWMSYIDMVENVVPGHLRGSHEGNWMPYGLRFHGALPTVTKDTHADSWRNTRFSLKAGAVKRYYITAEHRSEFLGQMSKVK